MAEVKVSPVYQMSCRCPHGEANRAGTIRVHQTKSSARKMYVEGRLCARRCGKIFPRRQEEPYKDRHGDWKLAWHNAEEDWQKKIVSSRTSLVKKPRRRDEET